tara:strand:- start:1087 stop:1296 length:210 start_codon:yes stop_codon:yes gene_type:complete
MNVLKPTPQERTVIAVMVGIAFGLVIGIWSMQKKVEEAEFERKLMMYHAEEMTEMNEVLMMQMEHMEEK